MTSEMPRRAADKTTGAEARRSGASGRPPGNAKTKRLTAALRWTIDATTDPSMAAADWLAADIDSGCSTAVGLLTDSSVSLLKLRKAKAAFKAMRIVGETPADRRLGARLYAAAIAAGLAWHGRRISAQSDAALRRAFQGLLDDKSLPEKLRGLGGQALCALEQLRRTAGG